MKVTGCGWASLGALLGLSAILACEKPPQDAGEATGDAENQVLARVGDEVVTAEDLGFVPARGKPSVRLEALVMRKLAAAEARRRGLAEEPKTRAKLAEYRRNLATWEEGLLRNALSSSIHQSVTLSEEELRAHFAQTIGRQAQPQWKLRVQKFASKAEARAAAADLGATGRLDPAKSETVGPLLAGQFPPDLRSILPLLKAPGDRQVRNLAGEPSLIELDTYLAHGTLSFEAARANVERDLRGLRAAETLNAELARLRAEIVVIDEAAVANLDLQRTELTKKLRAEREEAAAVSAAENAPAEAAQGETP